MPGLPKTTIQRLLKLPQHNTTPLGRAIALMEAQEHDLEDTLCAGTPALVGVG